MMNSSGHCHPSLTTRIWFAEQSRHFAVDFGHRRFAVDFGRSHSRIHNQPFGCCTSVGGDTYIPSGQAAFAEDT